MKLFFLTEGESEQVLYPSWVQSVFPDLPRIQSLTQWQGDGFFVLGGGGLPGLLDRVPEVFEDLATLNIELDAFFLVLDAEEDDPEQVREKAEGVLQRYVSPKTYPVAVIQTRCIETWLLGDQRLFGPPIRHSTLEMFRGHYDVSAEDPERLGGFPGFATRAQFHGAYLKAAAHNYNSVHTSRPKIVYTKGLKAKPYFEQGDCLRSLIARHRNQNHLASFGVLLSAFEQLGAVGLD